MAVGGDQVESVDAAQLRYFLESEALEGRLVLQGMQGDPFEQVSEGEVEIFGQSLQHLEQALLETYAGLDSFDFARRRLWNDFLGGHGGFRVRCLAQSSQVCGGVASMVPWYHCTNREPPHACISAYPQRQLSLGRAARASLPTVHGPGRARVGRSEERR